MRLSVVALLAIAATALATPAAACGTFLCLGDAVADDNFAPGETPLPYSIQEVVHARMDRGLSLAGFYNDPSLALARRDGDVYDAPRRRAYRGIVRRY